MPKTNPIYILWISITLLSSLCLSFGTEEPQLQAKITHYRLLSDKTIGSKISDIFDNTYTAVLFVALVILLLSIAVICFCCCMRSIQVYQRRDRTESIIDFEFEDEFLSQKHSGKNSGDNLQESLMSKLKINNNQKMKIENGDFSYDPRNSANHHIFSRGIEESDD